MENNIPDFKENYSSEYSELLSDINSDMIEDKILEKYQDFLKNLSLTQKNNIIFRCFPYMIKNSIIQPPLYRFKIVDFLCYKKDDNLTKNSPESLAQINQILSFLIDTSMESVCANLMFYENVLVLCCKYLSEDELNNEIKFNQNTLLGNILKDENNVWMLPILKKYGLNIHHVNGEPVFHYLADSAYSTNHFNVYWRFLIENDVSPQTLNVYGETILFPIAQKLTFYRDNIFSEEHFSLFEKNGISSQQLNFMGENFAIKAFASNNFSKKITENCHLLKKIMIKSGLDFTLLNKLGQTCAELIHLHCPENYLLYWDFFADIDLGWFKNDEFKKTVFETALNKITLKNEHHENIENRELLNSYQELIKIIISWNQKDLGLVLWRDYKNIDNWKIKKKYPLYQAARLWRQTSKEASQKTIENALNFKTSNSTLSNTSDKDNTVVKEAQFELFSQASFKAFEKNIKSAGGKEGGHDRSNQFIKEYKESPDSRKKTLATSRALLEKINILKEDFPHFHEVIKHIENFCILQNEGDGHFFIPPLLLAGGPGIGKTFFCHTVANIIQTHFYVFNMESMSSNWEITGLGEGWGNATPGMIFITLKDSPRMNPIFLLDEIDKCYGDRRFSPTNCLLPLLERYTAENFKDECIKMPINASHCVWIATANDLTPISKPLKNRFDIFTVPSPNHEQRKILIGGIYRSIIKQNSWGTHMHPALNNDVLDVLANRSAPGAARDFRKVLTTACAMAARDKRKNIIVQDIETVNIKFKMPWDKMVAA